MYQVNVLPECLIRLVDEPPLGAKDRSPRIRYVLRLLPKGERTEERHNYGIGKETVRLLEKTAQMLCEHYHLQPGEPLPHVTFHHTHNRSHRFEGTSVPYIFQYNHMHLGRQALLACIRFLLHGMVFQTSAGAPVVIKPHLLRHAFATYAVNIEGLPLDLVAKWLQQKNLEVTGYYSEMPEYMQVEQHASFVARLRGLPLRSIYVRPFSVLLKRFRSKLKQLASASACSFPSLEENACWMHSVQISLTVFTVRRRPPILRNAIRSRKSGGGRKSALPTTSARD